MDEVVEISESEEEVLDVIISKGFCFGEKKMGGGFGI